jgi:hypothetical protein
MTLQPLRVHQFAQRKHSTSAENIKLFASNALPLKQASNIYSMGCKAHFRKNIQRLSTKMKISTTFRLCVASTMILSVSACMEGMKDGDDYSYDGDENSGADGNGSGGTPTKSFRDLSREYSSLRDGQMNMSGTAIADMPVSGTTNYVGVAEYSYVSDQGRMLSDMSLTTNFQNSKVSGRLDNFSDPREGKISGGLDIVGNIKGNQFDASAKGRLTQVDAYANVDVDLSGDFLGNEASQIAGTGTGMLSIPNDAEMGLTVVFSGINK